MCDEAGLVDDHLMAGVDTIEVADGDHGAPDVFGQGFIMAKNSHGGKVSAAFPVVKEKGR
jgi:hypothetical protein